MAYIVPSVQVYQQLENAGGVLNSTPDLDAVIIGPMYNIVSVDSSDGDSLAASEVQGISGVVDGALSVVSGSEIVDWKAEQANIIAVDPSETGFRASIPSPSPGQEVIADEVDAHLTEVTVQVNSIEAFLPDTTVIDKSVIGTSTAAYEATFPKYALGLELPDSSGTHAQVGDLFVYTYGSTGTESGPVEASIVAIEDNGTSIRLSSPVPAATTPGTDKLVGKIYRKYNYLPVDPSYVETTNVSSLDQVVIKFTASAFPAAGVPADYGFRSGVVHVSYRALRVDKASTVLTINSPNDIRGVVGDTVSANPLGLGVSIALANTTTSIKAVAIASDDLDGYLQALELIEDEGIAYALAPMTQNIGILNSFKAHVRQMSTPENAAWRVLLCNTEIRDFKFIGQANDVAPATGTSVPDDSVGAERLYVEADASQGINFISEGVTPGDIVVVESSGASGIPVGAYVIEKIMSSTRVELQATPTVVQAVDAGVACGFYIRRDLTKAQQANEIALTSETFGSSRVWHLQPDVVGVDVNGITEYLPGYYLACGMAGMTAGFPVQQGFTNISMAGITDLRHSNFYFSKEDLNAAAEKGTCWFVQGTQGGTPYCRHEITTDVSVLQYREIVKVKNIDFLSYFYRGKLRPFIGSWNITEDTLNNMRQVTAASSELLVTQKLPRIGAPLLSYELVSLSQNENNEDMTDIRLRVSTVTPNNYTNLFLII